MKGSHNVGLMYNNKASSYTKVEGFVDLDYLRSLDTRKSLTKFLFTIYGGVVSRKVNLQPLVALSTTEAEYIAIAKAIKEAI